jgi:hypothetical protein
MTPSEGICRKGTVRERIISQANIMKRRKPVKMIYIPMLILLLLMLNGCARTTPINNLSLPPVTIIEGTVSQADASGFTLRDASGAIYVKTDMPENKKLNLAAEEKIKVYGNLQGGQKKIFDGYVIRKSTGESIIINKPTPHFGFILQTSFKE